MSNPLIDPDSQRNSAGDVPGLSSSEAQSSDASGFWRHKSVDELAAEQGVEPVDDVARFMEEFGDLWPEEENIDEFIAWLRQSRREGRYS